LNQKRQINNLLLLSFLPCIGYSQDLERIGKKDMLKISGSLNYSSVFYNASGIQNRRQPFTYFVSGSISGDVMGISLPFTMNYSNNQINYTQPYNIQSFNPSYKWIKGHAGITSMNFSPYTLAGHVFTGGGLELTPGKFKFASMYGKLKRASQFDFENGSDINMSYKRMGWGATAGYEDKGQALRIIYFGAKDDARSLTFIPINTNVKPMENAVLSLFAKSTLFKQFTIEGEYALSGLTRNVGSPEEINASPKNRLPIIFTPNATSQFFTALRGSMAYRYKLIGVQINYEKVGPEYQTLGAYYFNNDLENITLAPSLNLLGGKMNLSFNTGLQRNNLNGEKLNSTSRWVGALNASYAPDQHWSFSGSYSNFSSYTKQRPLSDPFYRNTLDTLNFYQLSQNGMGSIVYSFGENNLKQNTIFTVNYQVSGQNRGAISEPGLFGFNANLPVPDKVLNANLGHNIQLADSKLSIAAVFNANHSMLNNVNTLFAGPGFNIGRPLFKNLIKVAAGSTYNQVMVDGSKSAEVFSHRLSAAYAPKLKNEKSGKLACSLGTAFVHRPPGIGNISAFREFTGNVGLNYSF
jgi:hypothetical protein